VNCCGFDSIPPDIGVLYTVQQLPEDVPLIIEGFVRANGSFSGGTWRSAITGFGRMRELRERRAAEQQPATHQAPGDRSVYPLKQRLHYQRQLRGWGFPLPTIDAYIVRRSARAIPRYGPSFGYAHYGLSRSLPKIIGGGLGLGALVVLAQFGPTRNFLLDRVDSGDGPSAEKRAKSWFELTFVGRSKNGTSSVITKVSGGDPGYGETAKMASESALCLAFDRDKLPDAAGILTPAVAMGNALLERLQTAGIRFEVVERST
ncbi:MAG: saccharopine dehydrogenase, partial [Myxococcota bacterium]